MKGIDISFSSFEIKFEFNKKVIIPILEICLYDNQNYSIYATNFNEYYVKIFKTLDEKLNNRLCNQFVKTSQSLYKANRLNLKVHNAITFNIYKAVLIDSYFDNLVDLTSEHYFTTYLDLYRMIYQLCVQLQQMASEEIEGFQITPECVIVNNHMNFKITHLDVNLNSGDLIDCKKHTESCVWPLAPEYKDLRHYSFQSNIWDIGCLVYYLITKKKPEIDHGNNLVSLNFEKSPCNQFLKSFVGEMLTYKRLDRPKPEVFLARINEMFSKFIEPNLIKIDDPNLAKLQKCIFALENSANHLYFESFPSHPNPYKPTMGLSDIVSQIINPNSILSDESLKKLILDGWKTHEKHVKFYMELKEKLSYILNNLISTMKVLITLHSYIFRSSRACLAVFFKDGTTNVVEFILKSIYAHYEKIDDQFVLNYTSFLTKKFAFHFKHIKIVENNYSISKMWFVEIWKEMCSFAFIRDLINHLQFTFAVFNHFKRFKFNYFSKNCILFLAKEYINLFSLLVNVLTFVLYSKGRIGLSVVEKTAIDNFVDFCVSASEQTRFSLSTSIQEMSKKDFKVLESFQISFSLKAGIKKLREMLLEDNKDFNIIDFISIYFNKMIRIPESYENREFKIDPKSDNIYKDSKGAREVLSSLAKAITESLTIASELYVVPEFVQQNPTLKRSEEERFPGLNQQHHNGQEFVEETKVKAKEIKIHTPTKHVVDFGVQADLIKEEKELKKQEEMLKAEIKEPVKSENKEILQKEVLIEKKLNMREEYINMGKSDENFESQEGLEKFLLSIFARSVDEWIVNFNDIVFENLLASGSTCNVYRGYYRNLCVAIKKLTKPDNEGKIKFLKEFKREISLLVSLPNHPSLLTLIGFCIKNHEVYLISENCEGGTLFDVLYKKKNNFKLT